MHAIGYLHVSLRISRKYTEKLPIVLILADKSETQISTYPGLTCSLNINIGRKISDFSYIVQFCIGFGEI